MTAFDRSAATKLVEEAQETARAIRTGYLAIGLGDAHRIEALIASLASAVEYIGELERDLASMKVQRDTARLTSMNWENGYSGLEAEVARLNSVIAEAYTFTVEHELYDERLRALLAPVSTEPEKN